jgi:sulfate adenylyltransferase subunit 2
MSLFRLGHLDALEGESVYIMREVAAQFHRPVLLFSGGKDSTCLVRLAEKAFRPARFPFPLLHIDTGHNFPETLEFRDRLVARTGERLIVRSVQDSIDRGRVKEETGRHPSRNALQTVTLLDAIQEFRFDAAFGGARRDEEKARAKERVFSFRDEFGQWDPRNQRPELWSLYNGRIRPGEHIRVFPLSNWTEMDIWDYIAAERLEVPALYFSHRRACIRKPDGAIYPLSPCLSPDPGDIVGELTVRFRTVGDMTCTGATESSAATAQEIAMEVARSRHSERGSRIDDTRSENALEERKRQGYF